MYVVFIDYAEDSPHTKKKDKGEILIKHASHHIWLRQLESYICNTKCIFNWKQSQRRKRVELIPNVYNCLERKPNTLFKIMLITETMRNPDIADSTYSMIVVFTYFCVNDQMIGSLKSNRMHISAHSLNSIPLKIYNFKLS